MAEFTLTATDQQVFVIAYRLRVRNAERAAMDPPLPPLDVQGLMEEYLNATVMQYGAAATQYANDRLVEKYQAADEDVQEIVKTALGLDQ